MYFVNCRMRYFLILTLALSYSSGAPTDLDRRTYNEVESATTTSLSKEKSNYSDGSEESSPSIDWNNMFWISTTALPSIVSLPKADKKILCDFLDSFRVIRMELFAVIMAANMEFMANADKYFANELQEEMDKLRNANDGQEFFEIDQAVLQNKTTHEEYAKVNIVKANTLKMLNTIFQGTQIILKQLLDNAQQVKNSLTRETVISEQEFLVSLKHIKKPTKNYHSDIADLLNNLEIQFNHKYQCF